MIYAMKTETLTQSIRRRLGDYVGEHSRIALESGIPQTTISRIYRGESSPTIRNIEPLLAWFKKQDARDARRTKRSKQ